MGNQQTNEGTDRLANIVSYRSAIGAKKIQLNSFLVASVRLQKTFLDFIHTD